jgi:hypothetical protein
MVVLFQPFSDDELSLFDGCENVRSWHLADIAALHLNVRFRGVVSTDRRNILS